MSTAKTETTPLEKVETASAPAAIGPYSQAIIANGMLYTSGQLPIDPATGALVKAEIAEQARQVMDNIAAILAAARTDITRVVKTTCYLSDMANFAAFNAVYEKYFTGKPARSCVAVRELPKAALVEIEVIALL